MAERAMSQPVTSGPAGSGLATTELAVSPAGIEAEADGRRLRREQNREAVIDALLALFSAGHYQPSAAEIAAKAGLSPRSLFRYFDDVDDLYRAAADRQLQIMLQLLQLSVSPADHVDDKIRAVAHSRLQVYERFTPAARALRAGASRSELVAALLTQARRFQRSQLCELFAPELAGRAEVLLPAVEVLCSFGSYDRLRRESGLSPEAAAATLVAALTALLNGDPDVS